MKTTLRINDNVYCRAKAKSAELGLSLTRFFEEAVEDRLSGMSNRSTKRIELPVSSATGDPMDMEEFKQRLKHAESRDDQNVFK